MRFSVLALIGALLLALCFAVIPQPAIISAVEASLPLPVNGVEYTNGTIVPEHSPLLIWYDWVNVSDTQVINYAIYTTPEYNYPVPIANLLGQHFRMADGTQVFIASALSELEVFKDLNGDGIPQADFNSADNELLYYVYTNMSDSFSMTHVQKTMQDGYPHYKWSFTYENVHGYLQNAAARIGVVASLIFNHITLSYDFSVRGQRSELKTNFDIGEVANLNILDSSQFTLDGLSLTLLYATATYTSKPYSTYVNGQEYNSTAAEDSAIETELAQIKVDGTQAYDFIFGGSYILNRSKSAQTHIETYEAKAAATTLPGIPILIRTNPIKGMSFFREQLNLADLFGGSWQDFDIDYESSSLIYRICFPVWDGMRIEHDPVYIGYILSSTENTELPTPSSEHIPITDPFPAMPVLATSAVVAIIVAVGLLVYFKKHKRGA